MLMLGSMQTSVVGKAFIQLLIPLWGLKMGSNRHGYQSPPYPSSRDGVQQSQISVSTLLHRPGFQKKSFLGLITEQMERQEPLLTTLKGISEMGPGAEVCPENWRTAHSCVGSALPCSPREQAADRQPSFSCQSRMQRKPASELQIGEPA